MAGGKADAVSLRLNLYDKDVGASGWEFHGDVALSVVGAIDGKAYDTGFCFRPMIAEGSSDKYDCLLIRFIYRLADITNASAAGASERFVGYDVFAPRLDMSTMLPNDLKTSYLDSDVPSSGDQSSAWTVNTAKSYKTCPSAGNCVFNAHFFRNMQTGDTTNDY